MAKSNDDVIIKRNSAKSKTEESNSNNIKQNKENKKEVEINKPLYSKLFAILLALFAVLLFFSIVSYTTKDELNAKVSITEIFQIFSSDSMLRIKADTTYNWLGLLGAVMSNIMINWTIGYLIIFFPVFIFLWAVNIYRSIELSDKLIKTTSIYLIFSVLLSTFIGSIRNIGLFSDISKEWTGAVGTFLSTFTAKLISPVGAFLLFFVLIVLVVVFGTNIKWRPLIDFSIKVIIAIKDISIKVFKFVFAKANEFKTANVSLIKDEKIGPDPIEDNLEITEQKIDETIINTNLQSNEETQKVEEVPFLSNINQDPANFVKSILRPGGAIPLNSNAKRTFDNPTKPLNIKIDKPSINIPIVDKPLGLRDVSEEIIAVRNRSDLIGESSIIETNDESKLSTLEVKSFSNDEEIAPKHKDNQNTELKLTVINIIPNESNNNTQLNIPSVLNTIEADTGEQNIDSMIIENYIQQAEDQEQNISEDSPINTTAKESNTSKNVEIRILSNPPINIYDNNEKKLVVHVEESEEEEKPILNTPLGLSIHDEEIIYEPPTLHLLDLRGEELKVDDNELKMNARILQEKLETFKIYIEDLKVTPGPVVTQYEFVPAAGIKISRIESLADDLAMALKAKGIRIIAPIPGKGTVGIEIPNMNPSLVRFGHAINSNKFFTSDAKLPIALGKTISGEVAITDLAKAPHLLIAGSTGSGKSVGINTVINSLLFCKKPSDLKFVIIDPKKVELQQYSQLRHHFLALSPDVDASIITNPQDAVSILKSVVLEMEIRYDILSKVGQRNIADYNDKVKAGTYQKYRDFDHRELPYIVVVIDELADLMLTASKEVEEPIIRLAQMARAVGIHLIIATQRPSVDVITGIIKANFPARIAYLVASKIDSRTILDVSGAEQLLGMGDMLFLPNGSPKPIRIQNAFISTDEVENVCSHIGMQDGYSQPYLLPSIMEIGSGGGNYSAEDRDPLFEEAARLCIRQGQASVSLVQRRLKVGYARAGRIIDELEDAGIVGPNEGSKSRIVLFDSEADLDRIL